MAIRFFSLTAASERGISVSSFSLHPLASQVKASQIRDMCADDDARAAPAELAQALWASVCLCVWVELMCDENTT